MTVGRAFVAGAAALVLAAGVSAAAPRLDPAPPAPPAEVAAAAPASFADCAALDDYLRPRATAEVVRRVRQWFAVHRGSLDNQNMGGVGQVPLDAVGAGPTGTNLQEAGVDEPDSSKLDGDRLITLDKGLLEGGAGRLQVFDVAGDKPLPLGMLTFPAGERATELLVLGDHRVLVFGATPGTPPKAVLTLVDLSDSAHPNVVRRETVTGHYVSARLRDGVVRVVLGGSPRVSLTYPHDGDSPSKTLGRNLSPIHAATGTDWLPAREIADGAGQVLSGGPLMGCADVRAPARFSGLGVVSVLSIDTRDGDHALDAGRTFGVLGNGDLVYASPDRLYVATTAGGWGSDPQPSPATEIHAFDVTGRTDSPYVGTGTVPGYVFGRWAFSEHNGRLRVATTTEPPWNAPEATDGDGEPGTTDNRVEVLAEGDGRLTRIGGLQGLGRGEYIRAVRWLGDRAAVVTYREADPLYLIDLSRPTDPRLTGELHIPGYSAYLHPVGEGRLLGIGEDGGTEATPGTAFFEQDTPGVPEKGQVSSFDIADPAAPRRTDTLGLRAGYAVLDSGGDPRAFTYLPDRRLAIVPYAELLRTPEETCPACLDDEATYGWSALAFTVNRDGRLAPAGRLPTDAPVSRVFAVGRRLVAVTDTMVLSLDPDGLRPLGSAYLGAPAETRSP